MLTYADVGYMETETALLQSDIANLDARLRTIKSAN